MKAAGAAGGTGGGPERARKGAAAPAAAGLIQSYAAHGYEVLDIAVTADNARFASVGGDRQVFLWDVGTGSTVRRWAGHTARVNCVDFGGPDGGSVVASGSYDASVRLWDCKSHSSKPIHVLDEARDSVSSVHIVQHEIVTGCVDGRVRLYDLRMGLVYADVLGSSAVTCVRQTTDAQAVLVSTLDSTVRLMDKGNGRLLQAYRGHRNDEFRVRSTLGINDNVVLSGSEDGTVFVWDLLDATVLAKIPAHNAKVVSAVAFNGSKKEWASAGTDGEFCDAFPCVFDTADAIAQALSRSGECRPDLKACRAR